MIYCKERTRRWLSEIRNSVKCQKLSVGIHDRYLPSQLLPRWKWMSDFPCRFCASIMHQFACFACQLCNNLLMLCISCESLCLCHVSDKYLLPICMYLTRLCISYVFIWQFLSQSVRFLNQICTALPRLCTKHASNCQYGISLLAGLMYYIRSNSYQFVVEWELHRLSTAAWIRKF